MMYFLTSVAAIAGFLFGYDEGVIAIALPSLAERADDLPLLIEHFLGAVATRLKREPKRLSAGAYRALCDHEWRGNVRELEHALEQAVALASGSEIEVDDLPTSLRGGRRDEDGERPGSFREAKQRVIERFERRVIGEALEHHHGNVSKAADELGMYRQHLQLKLAEYAIDPATFRR